MKVEYEVDLDKLGELWDTMDYKERTITAIMLDNLNAKRLTNGLLAVVIILQVIILLKVGV